MWRFLYLLFICRSLSIICETDPVEDQLKILQTKNDVDQYMQNVFKNCPGYAVRATILRVFAQFKQNLYPHNGFEKIKQLEHIASLAAKRDEDKLDLLYNKFHVFRSFEKYGECTKFLARELVNFHQDKELRKMFDYCLKFWDDEAVPGKGDLRKAKFLKELGKQMDARSHGEENTNQNNGGDENEFCSIRSLHENVPIGIVDNFFSESEIEKLLQIRDQTIETLDGEPIWCFESVKAIKLMLNKHLNMKYKKKYKHRDYNCLSQDLSNQLTKLGVHSTAFTFVPQDLHNPKLESIFIELDLRLQKELGLLPAHGTTMQIVTYNSGEAYTLHEDCHDNVQNLKLDRMVSVIGYLSDVEKGGETYFPKLDISVKPKEGSLLVWSNYTPEGKCNPLVIHAGKKVEKGTKILFLRWYHETPLNSFHLTFEPPKINLWKKNKGTVSCDGPEKCRYYSEWSSVYGN